MKNYVKMKSSREENPVNLIATGADDKGLSAKDTDDEGGDRLQGNLSESLSSGDSVSTVTDVDTSSHGDGSESSRDVLHRSSSEGDDDVFTQEVNTDENGNNDLCEGECLRLILIYHLFPGSVFN